MLPIYSHTLKLLGDVYPELTAVIHVAPNKHVEEYISNAIREWPTSFVLLRGGSAFMKYDSFSVRPIIFAYNQLPQNKRAFLFLIYTFIINQQAQSC